MIKILKKKNRIVGIVSFQTSLRRSLHPRHYTSRPSFQMSDVESRISDVRSRMSDVESRMSDVGCQISDVGCRMSNLGCRMSDVESRMSNVGCRMSDLECRTSDVGCWMSDGTYNLPYDCTKYPKTMTAHKTEILNIKYASILQKFCVLIGYRCVQDGHPSHSRRSTFQLLRNLGYVYTAPFRCCVQSEAPSPYENLNA